MKQKKSASILKKFLLFNLTVFSVLGLFTIIYLEAIQPNLVKNRSINHKVIISNTVDNLKRLSIDFTKEGIRTFLLSTRFLFQSLDRVQFYDLQGNLIGDTNILDLDQSVFSRSDFIIEETIDGKSLTPEIQERLEEEEKDNIKEIILNQYIDKQIILDEIINNDYFVSTLSKVNINREDIGFIVVSEQANEIITAVKERKAFVIRTMIAVAIVILIFSLFLNKYILKPIGLLVRFSDAIKKKSNQNVDIKKVFVRDDEIGKLTVSIDEMTKELQQRTNRAETFSNDLAHEIRNPLASLNLTSKPIGFKIYLFKKSEKIKITIATAIIVLTINAFRSLTAVTMSLACSETTMKPMSSLSIFTLLKVLTKKLFFIVSPRVSDSSIY